MRATAPPRANPPLHFAVLVTATRQDVCVDGGMSKPVCSLKRTTLSVDGSKKMLACGDAEGRRHPQIRSSPSTSVGQSNRSNRSMWDGCDRGAHDRTTGAVAAVAVRHVSDGGGVPGGGCFHLDRSRWAAPARARRHARIARRRRSAGRDPDAGAQGKPPSAESCSQSVDSRHPQHIHPHIQADGRASIASIPRRPTRRARRAASPRDAGRRRRSHAAAQQTALEGIGTGHPTARGFRTASP